MKWSLDGQLLSIIAVLVRVYVGTFAAMEGVGLACLLYLISTSLDFLPDTSATLRRRLQ